MATTRSPRKGSLQYWPRKRAVRPFLRISHYPELAEVKLNGFAGYKVGMTHIFVADNRPNSMTKGKSVLLPATIIECPPLKVASVRFYRSSPYGSSVAREVFVSRDKNLARRVLLPKKDALVQLDEVAKELGSFSDLRLNVYTQPHLSSVGKVKPELFEIALGGKSVEEKFNYAKSIVGREIPVADVLREGQQVDVYAVSKGKGVQGPVKRFGVSLRSHKSEKGVRGPANVGSWTGNRSWTVAHAGRMGFHSRVERNKWLLKLGSKPDEINAKGGFVNYGVVRSSYILLRGSLPGHARRLVRLTPSRYPNHRLPVQAPSIDYVSLESRQG
ncbi:50S ribosomal protein L3 [Candidatus Woesearchaeota archaeon]|nr:50S ribosomal protein L3 [Candidatus Woesearchaeota archaeon]